MKEFIEKLIGRLEELYNSNDKMKKKAYEEQDWENFELFTHGNEGVKESIEIVNQLAEEYKQNIDQDLIILASLPSLYPLQPFEEEALHKVVSRAKDSGVWISCSTDMPEHDQEVFIKFSDGAICNGRFWIVEGTNYCGFNTKFGLFVAEQVAEWKPIATYQPKGE